MSHTITYHPMCELLPETLTSPQHSIHTYKGQRVSSPPTPVLQPLGSSSELGQPSLATFYGILSLALLPG